MRLDSSSALLRGTQIKVKMYLRWECMKSYILQVGRGNYSISLKGGINTYVIHGVFCEFCPTTFRALSRFFIQLHFNYNMLK